MSRDRWHIRRDGPVLTLARRLPARFDVAVATELPPGGRQRVASQIRQDLWRALQHQRGFSPVVEVTTIAGGLRVRAGGRVDGAFSRCALEGRIRAVLEDPARRDRWCRVAGKGRGTGCA
ncbi:hypothetical protein CLV78_102233 [Aliiruegeria haliotis]|uniref:Uncharacterized protein n=1 Tax=Aliiruegeria haliotis TaxID=1280846 RepID=A0A2T0RV26_9RHOB|nr:hypothetical protein [Aliiruegeria haliotis]PRY25056.1 hypothetical protein CLV78_102233 [Aliiruegeria haliotis]